MTRFIFIVTLLLSFSAHAQPAGFTSDCKDPRTTIETNYCLAKELDELKNKFESVYEKAKESAKGWDGSQQSRLHTSFAENFSALEKSQKSFEDYLKSECLRRRVLAGSGSGAGTTELSCEVNLLRRRIEEIEP
ncbi:MAG TPA: DUF1311 domain-containing protein [Alphaproteobacteria bacterium]|nr:DUF1311 domain-containing protein [Micavibrio sp.]MBK9561709.1 DUF1311 domain-containing protein [Micavibrio sp.]HQX28269.1 DUF1311 domain-containing protein [Alphaproteobacteria bacterium]